MMWKKKLIEKRKNKKSLVVCVYIYRTKLMYSTLDAIP